MGRPFAPLGSDHRHKDKIIRCKNNPVCLAPQTLENPLAALLRSGPNPPGKEVIGI